MHRAVGFALIVALSATSVGAQERGDRGGDRPRLSYADPSAVIAADLALGRVARDKGQRRALRDRAARGAVLFAPGPVDAATWLKRRDTPDAPTSWQARNVWMSCDGGFAVTRGAWTRGTASGEYFAVWQRQKKGDWKWLLREEGPPATLGEAPEMISAKVAECLGLPRRPSPDDEPPLDAASSASRDRSLSWSVATDASCGRTIAVQIWDGKALAPAFSARRDPPPGGCP